MKNLEVVRLQTELMACHWPKCNKVAAQLAEIGTLEAQEALIGALKAKRHHIRTASITALAKFSDPCVLPHIEQCLSDAAYETRMAAKEAVFNLTRKEVKTSRGE